MNDLALRWDRRQWVGETQWGPAGPVEPLEPEAEWNHGQWVGVGRRSGPQPRPVSPPDTRGGFSGFGVSDGGGQRWATGYRSRTAEVVPILDAGEADAEGVF